MRRYPQAIYLSIVLFMLTACSGSQDATPEQASTPQVDAQGRVQLTPTQVANLGIKTQKAAPARGVPVSGLPAEITVPLASSAQVTLPYAGVVTQVLVDEGETVQRGQPVLRVQSREWLAAQADWARARAESSLAAQQAKRDALLEKEGLIPAARMQESSTRAQVAAATVQQASAAMTQLRASGGSAGEFELLAPQSGRVLHRQIKPGQALEAMAPVFTLAADTRLDVQFAAPVELSGQLNVGQTIELPGGAVATIAAVGGDADAGAQSLRVRAQLAENSGLLPGQQLNITLQLPAPANAVAVPASALLQDGTQHLLFVQDAGAWRAIKVRQLGGDGQIAVVVGDGLKAGTTVVATGANLLKALTAAE